VQLIKYLLRSYVLATSQCNYSKDAIYAAYFPTVHLVMVGRASSKGLPATEKLVKD
jgi:hypothetical protein